jgi:hypothetical protein
VLPSRNIINLEEDEVSKLKPHSHSSYFGIELPPLDEFFAYSNGFSAAFYKKEDPNCEANE